MSSRSYLITALPRAASYPEAVRTHWREYLMEAAEVGLLMICICFAGALVYSEGSPLRHLSLPLTAKSFLMGGMVAASTYLIIRSRFGRRSGAHLNPAITLAYLWLDRIHRWDAVSYVIAQFAGGLVGVSLAYGMLGKHLAAPPVRYVVTLPGDYGSAIAFLAEFLLSAAVMSVILFATNHRRLTRFSPLLVALITVFYYVLCSSISGFSVNPARSFSSAFFAWVWKGIWIYFEAPSLGMLAGAAIYLRSMGPRSVYCAKLFHDLSSICPFPCHFEELMGNDEVPDESYERR
jgi:aquaporin Z